MDTGLMHEGSIGLNLGNTLRLQDAVGRHIGVVSGTVWITQENDSRDRVLGAGESFRVDHGGLALVSPLDTKVRLVLEDGLLPESGTSPKVHSMAGDSRFVHSEDYEQQARRLRTEAMGQVFAKLAGGLAIVRGAISRAFSALLRASEETAGKRHKV